MVIFWDDDALIFDFFINYLCWFVVFCDAVM